MQHPQQPVVLPVGGAAAAAAAGGGGGYASVLAATAAGAGTLSQGPHGTLVFTPAAAAAAPVATVQPVVLPGGAGTAPGGAAGAPTLLLAAGRGGVQQYTLLSAAPVLAGAPAAAAGSAPLLQLTPQQHGPAIVQQPAPGAALHAVPPGAVLAPAPLAPPGVPPDWAAGRRSYGAEQAQMGVRVSEFHELSPFAPFVHPSSALKLQALWDGGNELVRVVGWRGTALRHRVAWLRSHVRRTATHANSMCPPASLPACPRACLPSCLPACPPVTSLHHTGQHAG
jgi:hypothetical protein